jgi:hypothetical protein
MSTDQWRKRVERFRQTDPIVVTIVILALIALIMHEGFAVVTGRVPFAGPSGDGPYGRILLGLIASVTAFWVRQARKDVLTDTSITAEVRDRVSTMQENAGPSPTHESDVEKVLAALEAKSLASEKALEAKHQMERHKQESLLKVTQQEAADQREQALKWEMQARDLAEKLARCAESHVAGPRGEKGEKGDPGDKPC